MSEYSDMCVVWVNFPVFAFNTSHHSTWYPQHLLGTSTAVLLISWNQNTVSMHHSFLHARYKHLCVFPVHLFVYNSIGSFLHVYISSPRIIRTSVWFRILTAAKLWENSFVSIEPIKGEESFSITLWYMQFILLDVLDFCSWNVCINNKVGTVANKNMCVIWLLFSQLELVFCYTLLEQNKRMLALVSQSTEPLASVTDSINKNYLFDTFFPFDPYLLRRSV